MFSGLVRHIAEVKSFAHNTLEILTSYQARLGDSIAINGACLTVTKLLNDGICMELSKHTQSLIAMENYEQGQRVHLEPALKVGDKFDGHIVQGHIDGVGRITQIIKHPDSSEFWIETSNDILSYIVPKGSVCVDGISLTIVEQTHTAFLLTLIPHTLQNTLFGEFEINRRVNIETDIITRSVVKTMSKILESNSTNPHSPWDDIDAHSLIY